jgi:hypothetical protein
MKLVRLALFQLNVCKQWSHVNNLDYSPLGYDLPNATLLPLMIRQLHSASKVHQKDYANSEVTADTAAPSRTSI